MIDDEEAICKLLDNFYSTQGHKVKTVNNGADAIELTKREGIDLVLCYIAMPNVSGYDVIRVLCELERTPKIGIITGWGENLKPVEEGELKIDFIIT